MAAAKLRACFEQLHAHFRARHLAAATTSASAPSSAFRERAARRCAATRCTSALEESLGGDWQRWPEEYRDPDSEAVKAFAREHRERIGLHEYLQWQADLQLAARRRRAAASSA